MDDPLESVDIDLNTFRRFPLRRLPMPSEGMLQSQSELEKSVSVDQLRQFLIACPSAGLLRWKKRRAGMRFGDKTVSAHGASIFNSKFSANPVGCIGPRGYLRFGLLGYDVSNHRVLWALCSGAWPDRKVDHTNGVRSDNRLVNLRLVDDTLHCRNIARPRTNTSGFIGVCKTSAGRWRAYINLDNRQHHVGVFDTPEEAARAREAVAARYGFHPNHGRALNE